MVYSCICQYLPTELEYIRHSWIKSKWWTSQSVLCSSSLDKWMRNCDATTCCYATSVIIFELQKDTTVLDQTVQSLVRLQQDIKHWRHVYSEKSLKKVNQTDDCDSVVQRALAGREVDCGGRKSSKTVCLFTRIVTITTKPLYPRVPRGSRICEERSGQGKSVFPEISVNTHSPAQVNIHRCTPGQWEWFYIWTCDLLHHFECMVCYAELFRFLYTKWKRFCFSDEIMKSIVYCKWSYKIFYIYTITVLFLKWEFN